LFCANCGTKNNDDASFCSNCGDGLKGASKQTGATKVKNNSPKQVAFLLGKIIVIAILAFLIFDAFKDTFKSLMS
jgi:uncharacterized membrane protein YvbJ